MAGWVGGHLKTGEGLGVCNPPDVPVPLDLVPLVVVGDLLYMCGGCTNQGTAATCYTLSIYEQNSTWTATAPMSTALKEHSGVAIESNIWFVYGDELYDYDTVTGNTVKHQMQFGFAARHCAVARDGYSYVAGVGSNKDEVWVNNVAGDPTIWTKLVTLPSNMKGLSCVLIGNELYIIGGEGLTFLADSFALDIDTYTLRRLAYLNTPRAYAGAMVMNGRPAVVGGMISSSESLSSIEVYNNSSNEWTVLDHELQTGRGQAGFVQL